LAALVAAVTFGAGLDHFVATPRLYGWDWDAAVVTSEDPNADRAAIEAARGVQGVTAGNHGQVAIDGVSVASVALGSPRGQPPSVHPPVLEGRMATRPGEVVLGTTTLRRTGRSVGDQVTMSVADRSATATVVGRATFPRFAAYPGADKTGLGDGAILTLDDLEELIPGATTSFFLVRTGDVDALEAAVDTDDLESSAIVLRTPQRPDAIAGFERVNRTPLVLAGLLTVLAGAATAHGLVTTVRRRRRTFAVLKAMGFTRRQISSTVAWSSTTVAVVALLVGLPLGVAAGRSAWVVLADRMGAPAEPVTPVLVLLVAVPVVLLVANLVAWFPGRSAARIRPAVALRSE
jgi:predicted lysophospholipase L1 biosynthesis ABC-type transport system permease subunit